MSREALPKARLIRFVVGADGLVVPDLAGRLPGRGLWLQARRDVVETACAGGSFAKAAGAPVKVPPGLVERIEAGLRRRCLDIIGLARRAGELGAGYAQARAWLDEGRAAVLVEAIDGTERGRAKLLGARRLPLLALFTARELGRALGREQVVHVVLGPGALARRLLAEAQRLAGFAQEGGVELPSLGEAEARSRKNGRT